MKFLKLHLLLCCAQIFLFISYHFFFLKKEAEKNDVQYFKPDYIQYKERRLTSATFQHPLDPLTYDEYVIALELINNYNFPGKSDLPDDFLNVHTLSFLFPQKSQVLQWIEDGRNQNASVLSTFARHVKFDVSTNLQIGYPRYFFKIIVDVKNAKIIQWITLDTSQGTPAIIDLETSWMTEILANNPYFAALINEVNIDQVNYTCTPIAPMNYYFENIFPHRVGHSLCYVFNIRATVDLETGEILALEDCEDLNTDCTILESNILDVFKSPPILYSYEINRPKIEFVNENNEVSYTIDNHYISWQGFTFHEQFDSRVGVILSDIRYNGRSVIYNLFLSEIFVPYQTFDGEFSYRSFMDSGQFNTGYRISTYRLPSECPNNISQFLSQYTVEANQNISYYHYACIFERYTGNPRVRHYDFNTGIGITAPEVELVYRWILTNGNYDYQVEYVFQLDGGIKIGNTLYGWDAFLLVNATNVFNEEYQKQFSKTCQLVDENVCAIDHDHYLSWRIDFDIDQVENTFYFGKGNIKTKSVEEFQFGKGLHQPKPVHKSKKNKKFKSPKYFKHHIWEYEEIPATHESEAHGTHYPDQLHDWVVRSSNTYNKLGHLTGYQIKPHISIVSLLKDKVPEDIRESLAHFHQHGIWITKYKYNELYAAGEYTYMGQRNEHGGLPLYSLDNENIVDEDIVTWVTMGFRHVPKTEDYPTMTGASNHILLKPFHFLDANPAILGNDVTVVH